MSKLIVANWKSNPRSLQEALKLTKASDFKNTVIAPPYVYLYSLSRVLKNAALGAQDVFWQDGGPYTGEVSLSQLKNLKVKYVIIGHSERRRLGETDETVNKKVKTALKAGLKVILCVGEDWSIRRKGLAAAKRFVANQLKKDLFQTKNLKLKTKNLLIAYEPVWAIGTGRPDKPKDSAEITKYIKKLMTNNYKLKTKFIYGGSVTSKNVSSFLSQSEIDGALVGGASLKPKEIKTIIKISNSL